MICWHALQRPLLSCCNLPLLFVFSNIHPVGLPGRWARAQETAQSPVICGYDISVLYNTLPGKFGRICLFIVGQRFIPTRLLLAAVETEGLTRDVHCRESTISYNVTLRGGISSGKTRRVSLHDGSGSAVAVQTCESDGELWIIDQGYNPVF